jgi:hypothetical protein
MAAGRRRRIKASDLGHLASCETRFALERMRGGGGSNRPSAPDDQQRAYEALVAAHHNAQLIDRRCFVATELYGEDAPETDRLRAYRDTFLRESYLGRMVINVYYRVAPATAGLLRRSSKATRLVRWVMDRIVARLPRGEGDEG